MSASYFGKLLRDSAFGEDGVGVLVFACGDAVVAVAAVVAAFGALILTARCRCHCLTRINLRGSALVNLKHHRHASICGVLL